MLAEQEMHEKPVVNGPEDFKKMPEEYQQLVIHQMTAHTEGELTGADDYVHIFYPMAPDAYEKKVCCERAIEELDHYNRGSRILADIGIDTSEMLKVNLFDRDRYRTEAVTGVKTWPERAFFAYLGEQAVLEMLKEMLDSSYRPIAEMCVPVLKDEQVHVAHGYRILKKYCKTEEGRAELQETLNRVWPIYCDIFGRSESERSRLYVKWGLRKYRNGEARERFLTMIKPKLADLGLTTPPDHLNRKYT